MLRRHFLAVGSALAALLVVPAGALAVGTTVTVRVEGAKRTLLATRTVHTHGGSVTRFGAPQGACPATHAVGALQQATGGRWSGQYSGPSLGDEVVSIIGETYKFSSSHFWGFWINDKFAQQGVCSQTLHKGDRILFAPAPDAGSVYPTALRAPHTATVGHAFQVRVLAYNTAGKAHPLSGAKVSYGRKTAYSNPAGYVTVTPKVRGSFRFNASKKGYIRAATVATKVA